VNQLTAGNSVELQGLTGSLDFDLATGDVRSDYQGWVAMPIPFVNRIYTLNPAPATDGVWMDFP
jgi:hypothetical protein